MNESPRFSYRFGYGSDKGGNVMMGCSLDCFDPGNIDLGLLSNITSRIRRDLP